MTMDNAPVQRVTGRLPIATNDKWIDARTAGLALGLVLFSAIVVAPRAFWGGIITPDGYEHLGIAHAWVHGAGFVDPIQWNYYLTEAPPLPATAVRPPLISLLAAVPLAAGATIPTLILLHAAWSALMIGALFVVASRFMRRRAAVAMALLVATFPPWATYLAITPLSEVTAVGCYLLVLVTAGGILRSQCGAAICAVSTLIAAMTRPNFSALLIAVAVAAVIELGPRAALRHRGLWTYLATFAAGYVAIQIGLEATTGLGLSTPATASSARSWASRMHGATTESSEAHGPSLKNMRTRSRCECANASASSFKSSASSPASIASVGSSPRPFSLDCFGGETACWPIASMHSRPSASDSSWSPTMPPSTQIAIRSGSRCPLVSAELPASMRWLVRSNLDAIP